MSEEFSLIKCPMCGSVMELTNWQWNKDELMIPVPEWFGGTFECPGPEGCSELIHMHLELPTEYGMYVLAHQRYDLPK